MSKEFLQRCNEIVEHRATEDLKSAIRRVERERKGKGCGRLSCANRAVKEINEAVNFLGRDNVSEEYLESIRYRVDIKSNGMWKIKQGKK